MFALASLDQIPLRINLKCNPDRALQLREEFPDLVLSGYHMNKRHWNTVVVQSSNSRDWYLELIDHSYALVYKTLTLKQRQDLESC